MQEQASGSLLARQRITSTSATLLFTASMDTEVTHVRIVNNTGTAVDTYLYHDDAGSGTYDATTVIDRQTVAANGAYGLQAAHANCGIAIKSGGRIAVKADGAPDITVSLYGITNGGSPA